VNFGLIDPEPIIVGGRSQGGILSYLLATRQNIEAKLGDWKIKGVIYGPGGTDPDMLVMTSDKLYMQAEGIGGPPWDRERDDGIEKNSGASKRLGRKGAPESLPMMLVLQGKEDKVLPPNQAMAFRQACAEYGVPGKIEIAIYPREGHILGERAHLIGKLERVQSFCFGLLFSCQRGVVDVVFCSEK
jgi:acetyl esterase/lipase